MSKSNYRKDAGTANTNLEVSENYMNDMEYLDDDLLDIAYLILERDGFGYNMRMYSTDVLPRHVRIMEYGTDRVIARVLIPATEPKSIADIIPCFGTYLTDREKEVVLRMFRYQDNRVDMERWLIADYLWDSFHPEEFDSPRYRRLVVPEDLQELE